MTANSQKQVVLEYKSGLPDFLLSFVDSIIRCDESQILRYNFLHYNIDTLMREDVRRQDSLCLFFDPLGLNHIFIENSKSFASQMEVRPSGSYSLTTWSSITPEDESMLKYSANPFVLKYLRQSDIQIYSALKIVSIDQIRVKCQANVYIEPDHVLEDIFRVIAWNQIFRAKSANSYIYLGILIQKIAQGVNRRKFHRRFFNTKTKDLQRLLQFELAFKVKFQNWPYIPQKFRQYQQIGHYVPTPEKRSDFIQKRLNTKKAPIECPDNCVCFAEGAAGEEEFCTYSLRDGWVSKCPNRSNKIECDHQDKERMKKCRNAEIKKGLKKNCKKNEEDLQENNQIEECIMWGLDLYTRNVIFNCLPEVSYNFVTFESNKESKNRFIEETLLKAINFNGREGYDLRKACQLIINTVQEAQLSRKPKQSHKESILGKWYFQDVANKSSESQVSQDSLFSELDKHYAEILLQNYTYCCEKVDKTAFRIHTKGKGARCIKKQGIKQGNFIVEYFGELYEPWRWYEREDFIKEVMKKKKLKNYIPEFYNIYLEPHKDDPEGYDLMVVDPNKKGNYSSRFSHSCNPNCGTVTTVSNGRYYIGMYSFRDIKYGEELTFDYCCMTESNYEHVNSICLCGTQKCRGNYLELANSKTYSQLVDKNTCFFSRNSLILQALEPVTQEDIKLCSQFNIKERMLADCPPWIIKWSSKLLRYIESQLEMYKKELKQKWTQAYPWEPAPPEVKEANIELYSETSKNDLYLIRFQNLFTTVDKLKYFLNTIGSIEPPLHCLTEKEIANYMIGHKESILNEIQEVLIGQQKENESFLVNKFRQWIESAETEADKLFYFRLCCLSVSHMLLNVEPTSRFNSHLLADIIYFYAFTHTYFTANEYSTHVSEEIKVALSEITGKPGDAKSLEKIKQRYSSQFVWGQLVSWYKQTIVSPEASLSQDRRGTLSYPMIKSTLFSVYPFEKHCRSSFYKALREKSASSWPSAPDHGCVLSFKNPFKCYGTVFFQSIHSSAKFKELPSGNLQQEVLIHVNCQFTKKIELFKTIEFIMTGRSQLDEAYLVLEHVQSKFFSFSQKPKINVQQQSADSQKKKKSKKQRVIPEQNPAV